jgi:hypothetical protein
VSVKLRGFRYAGRQVIVTARGTCIPIHRPSDWLVVEVANYLAWVESLPELEPGSRRT